jgi:hypothetical protein
MAILNIAVLVLSSGAGSFCTALCQEVIAQSEIDESKCTYSSNHFCSNTYEKGELYQLNTAIPGGDCCELCLELSKCSEDAGYVLTESTKIKKVVLTVLTTVDVTYVDSTYVLASLVSIPEPSWLDIGSIPLLT